MLSPNCRAKIKDFDFDFGELAIKERSSQGNTLTKYPVKKITQKEVGESTLGAWKIWMDEASGRLNTDKEEYYLVLSIQGTIFWCSTKMELTKLQMPS
ncbi:MAG: hypothetical protein R2769_01355 [Saprospiraceae bacterium]